MHIADGLLSPPVCAATGFLSLGVIGYSLRRLKESLADRLVPFTGMMAALVFAGQMVNFSLGVVPVSGHLIGGVLAAVILGPWAGTLAITLVLLIQAFVFADGGLLSLGANIFNMGVVGSIGGYAIYSLVRERFQNQQRGTIIGAIVAAWVSVLAAAAVFCLEFRFSHSPAQFDYANIFTLMVVFHSCIGIGEAFITGSVVGFVLKHRPDLLYQSPHQLAEVETSNGIPAGVGRFVITGMIASLLIVSFLAPFASGHPDGLEAVAEKANMSELEEEPKVLAFADYSIPLPFAGWETSALWQKVSVALSGVLGVLSLGLLSWMFTRVVPQPIPAPAVSSGTNHVE